MSLLKQRYPLRPQHDRGVHQDFGNAGKQILKTLKTVGGETKIDDK